MANERLREAILRSGETSASMAGRLQIDPKTIDRWIATDRLPHQRNRRATADLVGEDETWLWPGAVSEARADRMAESEVVRVYARRTAVPTEEWMRLFEGGSTFIDILVYSGLFLPEHEPAIDLLKRKAADGSRVRLLLGNPSSPAVALRGVEEGIGSGSIGAKIENSLALLRRSLKSTSGVAIRLHDTTLYTSVYRADDILIANTHVYGLPAAYSPAILIRRLSPGGIFDTYTAMYDRVWDDAVPA
jgi:hypothetical protein